MAFNLLTVPCMAAVGAASGELGSAKRTALAILFWILTSYVGINDDLSGWHILRTVFIFAAVILGLS